MQSKKADTLKYAPVMSARTVREFGSVPFLKPEAPASFYTRKWRERRNGCLLCRCELPQNECKLFEKLSLKIAQ
jgi:hypothetical protein